MTGQAIRSNTERPAADIRLFVRQGPTRHRKGLNALLRLDIWGDSLLGHRVAAEMSTAYLILAVVFVFEVAAWSLLFNFVFHEATFTIDRWTLAAVALGGLWGAGIFAIDKGLITADLLRPGGRKWAGFAARTLLILVSAVLTAQPIEQLVFHQRIDQRLKDETLLEEAVAQVERIKNTRDQVRKEREREPERELSSAVKERLQSATETREKALPRPEVAKAVVDRRRKELAAAEGRRDRASAMTNQLRAEHADEARIEAALDRHRRELERVNAARDELQRAVEEEERATAELASAQRQYDLVLAAYDKAVGGVKAEIGEAAAKLEGKAEEKTSFVDRLREARYGDEVHRENGELVRWRRADFVERAVILDRLTNGQPPRWPPVDAARKQEAIKLFGVPASELDDEDAGRSLYWPWLALLLVAGAIPALAIFFKFTMSDEMKSYYSLECQARAGNPEALLQRQVGATGASARSLLS